MGNARTRADGKSPGRVWTRKDIVFAQTAIADDIDAFDDRCCGSWAYAVFAKASEEMQMMALRKASQTTRYECIGAGSLEVSSGYLLVSPPEFPDGAKQER